MFLHKLEETIADFIQNSEQNFVDEFDMMQIYDPPLLGVAGASDQLWEIMKEPNVVGPDHLTPKEWLSEANSVISYFLPFTEEIRSSNRLEGLPSKEWLYGRCEGEMFNDAVRLLIIDEIEVVEGKALAPALDKRFTINNYISNWSERHVAFIAGLGTFSLSHSLITNFGTAGRIGSVIVDLELEPKPRLYQEVEEYCSKCGTCINRCPPRAITENNKDEGSCSHHLDKILELNKSRYGCGKCQTAVPCEYSNPTKLNLITKK
ncbi:epoxyqueuosine reductase [Methanobacterium sp. VT]|uniref:Epoxyqueuosine reductase n=1 Tax=Methanobacterium spitsbergense TaxID=2874285 RepID=A0A8T5V4F6_9EURY|nr:epoxyqueuosine reductase [Methanobacterium spitsbergense]